MRPRRVSGRVVVQDGVCPGTISFDAESGTIISVDPAEAGQVDETLIFPGFIDIHVHAREYPRPAEDDVGARERWEASCRKETFSTAGEAALNGGVTLFAAMPNDPNPPSDKRSYARKLAVAADSRCPVILYALITPSSAPWAYIPYKVYLDATPSAGSFSRWADLETALGRYRGCRVFFHAEDPVILARFGSGGPRWKTRPPEAEVSAVEKILELTGKLGLKSHICHVSTEKAVGLIVEYNSQSQDPVTCEVTPHHLFFSVTDGLVSGAVGTEVSSPPFRPLLECNPPLRSEADRRFLLAALKEGSIDVLASDHAPHLVADKNTGAPGMPHLDTLGPFAGWLIKECGFSPERIAEVMSAGPARILSADLDLPHGLIEPGAVASFTVLDLARSTLVVGEEIKGRGPLKTKCGWSPFSGIRLPASVASTVIRGEEHNFRG